MPSYNNPDHPEHKDWLLSRRKRFAEILREGKRICKLEPHERDLAVQLATAIEKTNKKMEGGK